MKGVLLFSVLLGGLANAAPWDGYNDPHRFGSDYVFSLSQLPLKGEVSATRMPWSESYWPRNKGSINFRWNASPPVGFGYRSPTREEVLKMSEAELSMLSPTEKYDLYRGKYDYPLKNYISSAEANRNAPDWAGICDGWTASAIELREPKPVIRVNPDGVRIPFGASDLKGLISYTAARQNLNSIVIGRYCPFGLRLGFANCQDINPGAYHVILANEVGIRSNSFPAEIDPGKEAWNQPVRGIEFEILGSAAVSNPEFAASAVRIHSKLHYVDELDQSLWDPVTGTAAQKEGIQESDYVLELDGSGAIVGGYWLSKYSHPDVFWRATKGIEFDGDFARLKELYEPVN